MWNRINSPELDLHKYSQLIFDKGENAILWNKDRHFDKWYWNNWTFIYKKKMNLEHIPYIFHKN